MLNRADLILLALLTLFWGINWPIMKYAVLDYPPLAFRSLSMLIGLVAVWAYIRVLGESFTIPRAERKRVAKLTIGNMLIWHLFAIYGIKFLSSGRAAILGYTMPVWAMLASVFFSRASSPGAAPSAYCLPWWPRDCLRPMNSLISWASPSGSPSC